MFHVALLEPEIAGNTGSVARTCVALGAALHLIRPFGFRFSDAELRRAGMDYWSEVDTIVHQAFETFAADFAGAFQAGRVFGFSTKAGTAFGSAEFLPGDVLLFGPESRGLPARVLATTVPLRIPMQRARSLNLAISVAVAGYEVWRQLDYRGAP